MSRRRKNDVFSEAIVGLFMIAVLALLVYFTIIISGVDVLKGRQKVIANIAFDGVGGLKEHDNVMYRCIAARRSAAWRTSSLRHPT